MKKKINNEIDYNLRSNISYQKERNINFKEDSAIFLASKEENKNFDLFKPFEDPVDDKYFENSDEDSFQKNYYLFLNEDLNDSKKK